MHYAITMFFGLCYQGFTEGAICTNERTTNSKRGGELDDPSETQEWSHTRHAHSMHIHVVDECRPYDQWTMNEGWCPAIHDRKPIQQLLIVPMLPFN